MYSIIFYSLNTGNDLRDNHLRSPDFFDAKQFPTIQFRSTAVTTHDKRIEVAGILTVKGIEHPFTFNTTFLGMCADPLGNTPAEFGAMIAAETALWADTVKSLGLKF